MIDEGNLLRFVQVRGTVVCHMLAPMSWPDVIMEPQDEGQSYEPSFAYLGCQASFVLLSDALLYGWSRQIFGGWPKALAWADGDALRHLGIPTSRCDAKSGPQKKITCTRSRWHPFVKKLKKIWGGTLKIWTLKCKVVPQLMEITSHLWWREARLQHPAKKGREHSRSKPHVKWAVLAWKLEDFRKSFSIAQEVIKSSIPFCASATLRSLQWTWWLTILCCLMPSNPRCFGREKMADFISDWHHVQSTRGTFAKSQNCKAGTIFPLFPHCQWSCHPSICHPSQFEIDYLLLGERSNFFETVKLGWHLSP